MESKISEIIRKSASSLSAKYETSISTKTEVDNQFRSLRKFKNPNPCQPVTFHYFQIMKKFRRELFLIEQTYDCSPIQGIQRGEPGVILFAPEVRRPSQLAPDIVAPPPFWTVGNERKGAIGGMQACRTEELVAPLVEARVERPTSREMTKHEVLEEFRATGMSDAATSAFFEFDQLVDPGGGGLIWSEEYCVGTDSTFVQAQVSDCAACEEAAIKLKELDLRKRALELDKLECEIALCRKGLKDLPKKPEVDPV